MTNGWELLLHTNRLTHRLRSTSKLFAPSFFLLLSNFWLAICIDPRGQAPMGLSVLGRPILLLEISTLVAFSLAAVNGEPSPYSFPPCLNW